MNTGRSLAVSRESKGGHAPHKCLAYLVIQCSERRYPKQNTVPRLKSSVLATPKFLPSPKFWAGYAIDVHAQHKHSRDFVTRVN